MFYKKNKNKEPKIFEAIQIEVSSLCNLKCKFCPTTYLKNTNEQQMLSFEAIENLESYFGMAKWVYLQGWGEPLLNKEIWKIAELAKNTGAKVGFTTNGTLLNQENIDNIIRYGVDLVSISIAGAIPETHNSLRVNSHLENILDNLNLLKEAKKLSAKKTPRVSLSYMVTTENIHQLPEAVKVAVHLEVDDMYTTNLDYVFNEETNKIKAFSWEGEENSQYEKIIKEAKKYALTHKLSFRTYPLQPEEERPVCDLDPRKFVFITSNGDVTPCTYLGRTLNPRYFKEEVVTLPRKIFGNIYEDDFWGIWNSEKYQEFKAPFNKRDEAYQKLLSTFTDYEPNLYRIKNAEEEYYLLLKENPVPQECRTCPKIFGI